MTPTLLCSLPVDERAPTSAVCDVCQDHQAIVTLGCVDYCARCAPAWRPGGEAAEALERSSS